METKKAEFRDWHAKAGVVSKRPKRLCPLAGHSAVDRSRRVGRRFRQPSDVCLPAGNAVTTRKRCVM